MVTFLIRRKPGWSNIYDIWCWCFQSPKAFRAVAQRKLMGPGDENASILENHFGHVIIIAVFNV